MPNDAMKHRCCFMAGRTSFRFRRPIRIGRATRRDGRARYVATDGDATMICLDACRCRLWRFPRREQIDKDRPKSCRHNDQPTPEPPENLLVALVTQEPPQAICAFEVALGSVGLRRKLGGISSGKVNTILFQTTDQSVHVILK